MPEVDATLVGATASGFMDALQEDYGEDAEILEVAIVAYVLVPNEDGDMEGQYLSRFSDLHYHHQNGLLDSALESNKQGLTTE